MSNPSDREPVTREHVREMLREETQRIADNADLATKYPELTDRDSEFFKTTALEIGRLAESTPRRAMLAAQAAELRMRREGKWKDPPPPAGSVEEDGKPSPRQAQLAADIIGGDRQQAIEAYRDRAKRGVNVSLRGPLAGALGRDRGGE